MNTFRLSEANLVKKPKLTKEMPYVLTVLVIAAVTLCFYDSLFLQYMGIILLSFLFCAILILYTINKNHISQYTLTITDNEIIREQDNSATICISHSEIKEIIQYIDGGIIISTNNYKQNIFIQEGIEEYALLETSLNNIRTIQKKEDSHIIKLLPFLSLLMAFFNFQPETPYSIIIHRSICIVGLVSIMYIIQKDFHIQQKFKNISFILILAMILPYAHKIYLTIKLLLA